MRMRMILPVLFTAASMVAAPTKPELQAKIDAYVAPLVAQRVFSGVVLVAKGDEILVNRAFGNANYEFDVANTPQTRFAIASITKMFTNVILRQLEAEKKVSLSDPL